MSDLQKELEPFPDEAGLSFVGSVDDGGFPQVKAMLAPRPTTNRTRPPAVTIRSPSAFVPM